MKKLLLMFLIVPFFLFGQKKKVNFNLEIKGNTYAGIGDNYIADGTGVFGGFGIGMNFLVVKRFGLGFDFNKVYGSVSDQSVFGDLHSPEFTSGDFYAFYRHPFSQKFDMEGQIGGSVNRLTSRSRYRSTKFHEDGSSFLLGAKALYSLSSKNDIYIFANPKFNFVTNQNQMDDPEVQKYYAKPTLFNFSVGVRIYL